MNEGAGEIRYIVNGRRALSGEIVVNGNKNAALPIIAACLLTSEPITLHNVPFIKDTEVLVDLIKSMGVKADWEGRNVLKIEAVELNPETMDVSLVPKIRASILLLGPILARCGAVEIPRPGGDVIGRRRTDTHFLGCSN